MFPSPRLPSTGRSSPPTASARCTSVSESAGSPELTASGSGPALDDLVEALPGEAPPAAIHEQPRLVADADERRAAAVQVQLQRRDRLAANRHDALLGALAAGAQDADLQVDVRDLQLDRLRRA